MHKCNAYCISDKQSREVKRYVYIYMTIRMYGAYILLLTNYYRKNKTQNTDENKNKKRRKCRFGAGEEQTYGLYDTEGFLEREEAAIVEDDRGYKAIHLPRNHKRLLQTSTDLVQSWRANCDIQLILYDTDPNEIDPAEISKVVDYIVGYACKGNEKIKEEKDQIKSIIMR